MRPDRPQQWVTIEAIRAEEKQINICNHLKEDFFFVHVASATCNMHTEPDLYNEEVVCNHYYWPHHCQHLGFVTVAINIFS